MWGVGGGSGRGSNFNVQERWWRHRILELLADYLTRTIFQVSLKFALPTEYQDKFKGKTRS